MYTPEDVAKRWGVSLRHVRLWIQSGRLKPDSKQEAKKENAKGTIYTYTDYRFSGETLNRFHAEHGFCVESMPLFA